MHVGSSNPKSYHYGFKVPRIDLPLIPTIVEDVSLLTNTCASLCDVVGGRFRTDVGAKGLALENLVVGSAS
jgi:hypothetical protein